MDSKVALKSLRTLLSRLRTGRLKRSKPPVLGDLYKALTSQQILEPRDVFSVLGRLGGIDQVITGLKQQSHLLIKV